MKRQPVAEPKKRGRKPKIVVGLPNFDGAAVSTMQAVHLVMLSAKRIEQLVFEGYIKKQDDGRFRLIDLVQGMLRYERETAKPSTKSAAAAEVQNARAEEVRIRIDERRQRLLREAQTEAIDVLSEVLGGLRADLLSVPPKLCPDLRQRAKLAEAIDGAFGAASRRAIAAANLVADSGKHLRAAGADKPGRVGRKKPNVSG